MTAQSTRNALNRYREEIVNVAVSGGDFTSVKDACDSIVDASATKQYIVNIGAGTFYEDPFTVPSYVKLLGAGRTNTILRTNDLNNHFITLSPATVIRTIGIYGPTAANKAAIYHAPVNDARPSVVIETGVARGYYGILTAPTVVSSPLLLETDAYLYDAAVATPCVTAFIRATDYAAPTATLCEIVGPASTVSTAFSMNGANVNAIFIGCQHECSNGEGAYVDTGAIGRFMSCRFANGTNAIHIGPNGASTKMRAVGCQIQQLTGGYTKHILIDSATAIVSFEGTLDSSRIDNAVGASLAVLAGDVNTATKGSTTIGELRLGADYNTLTPLLNYGQSTWLSGLVSGGAVTRVGAGSRVLDVAAGVGYINDGTYAKKITFGPGTATITANSTEYVYVTSAGTITRSGIQPDYATNIVLAQAVSDATDIVLLTADEITIGHQASRIQEYLEDVIGPINITGLNTTINGGDALKVDVHLGEFVVGLNERDVPADLTATPFYYWYNTTGTWTSVASTQIDTSHWNDIATGLSHYLGVDHWKKDLLFVTYGGDGAEVHIVYGQEVFNTQVAAEQGNIPVPPDIINHYAMRSAGIVSHDGDAAITSIVDYRPHIGQQVGVTVPAAADHNLLLNLTAPNNAHTQYLTTIPAVGNNATTWHGTLPGAHVTNGDTHDHTAGAGAQINHTTLSNIGVNTHAQIDSHIASVANPHVVTAAQVGNTVAQWNANQIQSRNVSAAAPATKQALVWNAGVPNWEPGAPTPDTHGSSHISTGSDPVPAVVAAGASGLMTGADKTKLDNILGLTAPVNVNSAVASAGVSTDAAHRDHKHSTDVAAPVAVGTANNIGVGPSLSNYDHVHAHGSQPLGAGTDHAVATPNPGGVAGFMSAADKTKLDSVVTGIFGANFQQTTDNTRTTNTGNTYPGLIKSTLTTGALTGTYRISWSVLVDNSSVSNNAYVRIQNTTDATTVEEALQRSGDVNERHAVSGFAYVTFTGAAKTFRFEAHSGAAGTTVGLSYATLEIFRVS